MRVPPFLYSIARLACRSDRKVVAVFGVSPPACLEAVRYVRAQLPEYPVWLFCTSQPLPETEPLCERVIVRRGGVALLFHAQCVLLRRWVALSVGTWTGERGPWPLKLAPFFIPPFRPLFMNRHGDFLGGFSCAVVLHIRRSVWQSAQSAVNASLSARDQARDRLLLYARRLQDGAGRLIVRVIATGLRMCGYPHRTWFRRSHGDQALSLAVLPAAGSGLVRFHAKGSGWPGAELETLARSNTARWILWQEEGAADPVESLSPLFADPRTFAVSVQGSFRAWKSSLLPMAPFRTLQPDEASPVLAPLSRTILVDRQKLAMLGIPRCRLAGAAWLLLFWKAAAAGWRSYSVGQKEPLREQPDFPIHEAAFFLRFVAHAEVRRLAPAQPDLVRGNFAFPFAAAPASPVPSSRLRVLIVSPFLPYPLSHGGAVRIFNLCRALCDRVEFFLVAVREQDDRVDYERLRSVFRGIHVADLDELPSADESLPAQVRHHESSSLRALIRDRAARIRPDLIQIEYAHMAAFRDAEPSIPTILVEHDLTFSLYRQLKEAEPGRTAGRECARWQDFERRQFRSFDAVWTMSRADRRLAIQEGSRADRTFTVPNGVDTRRFTPAKDLGGPPEILYVGSFRHLPNILGFEKLRQEVMPRVWARRPDVVLRVVAGPRYEFFWRRFRQNAPPATESRVEIHGFVEDLRPLYARAAAVVVPLDVSAGTNIKVLEAMACGKAIVTTPAGCAGLGLRDGTEALIHGETAAMASALCDVLSETGLRSRLGSRARQTAEARFDWQAIARRAYESYQAVAGLPSSAGTELSSSSAAD